METSPRIRRLALTGLFAALIVLLNFTPFGYIQLPFIKATIVHVPVIIGSILLGPASGAVLGALFGLTSLINNTFTPAVLSFAFSPAIPVPGLGRGSFMALCICFVPRILVGVVPYYVHLVFTKLTGKTTDLSGYAVAGVSGALTNTILVMSMIFFIFKDAYATARDIPADSVIGAVMTVVFVNGVPEALIAAVIVSAICKAVSMFFSPKSPQ